MLVGAKEARFLAAHADTSPTHATVQCAWLKAQAIRTARNKSACKVVASNKVLETQKHRMFLIGRVEPAVEDADEVLIWLERRSTNGGQCSQRYSICIISVVYEAIRTYFV